MTSIIA